MDTEAQPALPPPCPACGNERIVADLLGATVGVKPTDPPPTVASSIMSNVRNPIQRWMIKQSILSKEVVYNQPIIPDSHRSHLQALVCKTCGYTALYTVDPTNLLPE